MTTYQWAMVSIAAAGFLVTIGGMIGACVWAVARVKETTVELIKEERIQRGVDINTAMKRFEEAQDTQDHNFGEMGSALRAFIQQIEKKVYEVELYGRDNYALKHDVFEVRKDIKEMRADIKSDITELGRKIDRR
jgi:hypothetical protein